MAAQGAETIHRAFDEHHQCLRALTRRVRRRFEERDWEAAVVRHMLVTLTGRTGG